MNIYSDITTYWTDFQTEASNYCFGTFQPIDFQYSFELQIPFSFTGKELDSETGYSYFGARYYDADLSGLFFSVDPMADKYPNMSPYAYCAWNPITIVDKNGNDGVKIVDKRSHRITVTATYYVTSEPLSSNLKISYSLDEIRAMQKEINNVLNSQGYTYEMYGELFEVFFDLKFVAAGESWMAEDKAHRDPVGNSLSILPEEEFEHVRKNLYENNCYDCHIGGVTDGVEKITMNSSFDNTRRRIHEIIHTLFFDNDNADKGIGNYDPGTDLPNEDDINLLLSNPRLTEIIKDNE